MSDVLDFIELAQEGLTPLLQQAQDNPLIIPNQEWPRGMIYNTALLEGSGGELLKLQAPASASKLETAVREMATAMKNAGYNTRIGYINLDTDALALGSQQTIVADNAAKRVDQEMDELCVPSPTYTPTPMLTAQQYAEACGASFGLLMDSDTWGEIERNAESTVQTMEALRPPAHLVDYHEAAISVMESLVRASSQVPPDTRVGATISLDPITEASMLVSLMLVENRQEELDAGTRFILIQSGCW